MSTRERRPTLRGHGERVTGSRRAVIEVLDGMDEHLTADEIAVRASAMAPGVHRTTVYRALATLADIGLVIHTHIADSATVYHLASEPADHHHAEHAHVQCTSCGMASTVAFLHIAGWWLLLVLAAAGGTILKPGEEVFWGGYSGYFADPDGHTWEVAWNPGWSIDDAGHISMGASS